MPPNATDGKKQQSEACRKNALELMEASRSCREKGDMDGSLQKLKDAKLQLEEALKIYPQNHRARFLLVNCSMAADDYSYAKEEALTLYKSLPKEALRRMDDAVLHLSLAHASKMLGQMDDAARYAREATELYTDDPHPHMILGELSEVSGDDHQAEIQCMEAIRIHETPGCKHQLNQQSVYFTLCCLGVSLIKQNRSQEAEPQLKKAYALDDSLVLAPRHLVDCYHFQGRNDEALQMAHKIQHMEPDNEEIKQKIHQIESGEGPIIGNSDKAHESDGNISVRSVPKKTQEGANGKQDQITKAKAKPKTETEEVEADHKEDSGCCCWSR